MSSLNKKIKSKQNTSQENNSIAEQLKIVVKKLNEFLKINFEKAIANIGCYAEAVKQYFIAESTNSNYHCLIGTLLSKISNMLQPFIQPKLTLKDLSQYKMKQEISNMSHKIEKYSKKIKLLKEEINKYNQITIRLTNFIYMLRVNNIDVDLLYEKGCEAASSKRQSYQNERDFQIQMQPKTEYLKNKQILIQNFQSARCLARDEL